MSDHELPVKMNRDFKGIWIPREIWIHPKLLSLEKMMWAEIHSLFDRRRQGCYASNQYLSQFFGVSERYVREMISKLKSLGLVKEVSFDGRTRVIMALLPKEDFSDDQFSPDRNQGSGKGGTAVPVSPEPQFHPLIYRDTSIVTSIETPPYPPQNSEDQLAGANVANATGEVLKDSPKSKRERKPSTFEPKVREVAAKMLSILVKCNPVYRPPENMEKFLSQVQVMLETDKQDPELLLKTFEWACADSEQRDSFKGWQSVVCTNKRKGKVSNPAEIFRGHFSTIYAQMISQPKRKFAPSSNDARSLAKWEAAMKDAI